jgi:DNA-binding IclR family transcriptional regulator
MSATNASSGSGPNAIHKAFEILRAFTSEKDEWGVRELTAALGLPRSTVHRMLSALEREGVVEQDPRTGRYLLGFELVALAGSVLRHSDVRRVALPYMTDLATRWHETVDLDVLRGAYIIIIEQIPGRHVLSTGGTFAARLPAHCTSTGKVLLAHAGPNYVEANLPAELTPFTPDTIRTRTALLEELEQIRRQGYARAWGEHEGFVRAVAVPVRGRTGEVTAAMSISGPSSRIDESVAAEMIALLKSHSAEISSRLGFVGG